MPPRCVPSIVALLVLFAGSASAQEADRLPARVIVKFRPEGMRSGSTAQEVLAKLRERPSTAAMQKLSIRAGTALSWRKALGDGSHVFVADDASSNLSGSIISARLRGVPEVVRVENDRTLVPQSTPTDPYFPQLWALTTPAINSYGADFVAAWMLQQGSAAVRIAVIDTGILPHPDITGPAEVLVSPTSAIAHEGYDFISDCRIRATCPASTSNASAAVQPQPQALDRGDWVSNSDRATAFFSSCKRTDSSWHGTHVAGTAVALANNDEGIAGGAYGAQLVPVRVLGKCGGYMSDVAEGIRWAAGVHPTIVNPKPARVLNLSLGALGTCDATLQDAIDAATGAGALVVVAAGNDATQASTSVLPSCMNVVAVAASTRDGSLAYYSNYSSTHIAVSAPGGDTRFTTSSGILSLSNSGSTVHDSTGWEYKYAQGTSSAAPHVAAAAALMFSRNGTLSPAQSKSILTAPTSVTAFPPGSRCAIQGDCGIGILNVQRAVSNSLSPLRSSPSVLDFGTMAVGNAASREVVITNESSSDTLAGFPSFLGAAGYSLSLDDCSGRNLQAAQSCQLVVTFTSAAEGRLSGTLQVPTESGYEATITSVQLDALVGSRLTSATAAIPLPELNVGDTYRVTIAFQSRYAQNESVRAMNLIGTDAVISGDACSNTTLLAGSSCEVEITITALAAGPVSVQVAANTVGVHDVPFVVAITGTAIEAEPLPSTNDAVESSPTSASPSLPPSGGGGGGTLQGSWLVLFAFVVAWRRAVRRRFPRPASPAMA